MDRKFAAILGIYGKPSDRFMAGGYKDASPDVFRRIQLAAGGGIVRAVELIHGDGGDIQQGNREAVQAALADHGLGVCALNPDLWGEPQWYRGTLGARDPKIARLAIQRIKATIDLAAELGCESVGIWPGQDGFDYLFEVDYLRQYDQWVAGVQELCDHNQAIKLCLEYKPYEPRTHSTLDTCPKTLLMLQDIDRPNAGLTIDVGHALVAHENLAEAAALSQRRGKLFHLHLNDNFADWDWDLNFGAVHLFDFIELAYWLLRTGYQGWYSVDIFAYRLDAAASVNESLAWLGAILDFVESSGLEQYDQLIAAEDPLAVSAFFRRQLFPKLSH